MEAKAKLSYLHIAPRKVRLVASLLRGMDARKAELELRNLPKRSSEPLGKLLKSAIQNAVHDLQMDPSRLYIKIITVDGGPVLKRMMPRAFGRGAQILKRMSHVTLVLGVRGEENTPKTASKKIKKTSSPEIREADWEEVKGEATTEASPREAAPKTTKKRSAGFGGKKTFTRKVI